MLLECLLHLFGLLNNLFTRVYLQQFSIRGNLKTTKSHFFLNFVFMIALVKSFSNKPFGQNKVSIAK